MTSIYDKVLAAMFTMLALWAMALFVVMRSFLRKDIAV